VFEWTPVLACESEHLTGLNFKKGRPRYSRQTQNHAKRLQKEYKRNY
jgi:hypothetical protein